MTQLSPAALSRKLDCLLFFFLSLFSNELTCGSSRESRPFVRAEIDKWEGVFSVQDWFW